jgi:large subunit ribosomal protein L22
VVAAIKKEAGDLEAKAVEKYIRISPRKIKYVVEMIKTKPVDEAIDILSLTPKGAAVVVKKALQSAVANATENHKMKEEDLYISKIMVNEGPTLKRFRPRARGRATRIRKRTTHLSVYVSDGKEKED